MIGQLTGEQKGALLLKCLAAETAESILTQLPTGHRLRLRKAMQDLQPTPDMLAELDKALQEINQPVPTKKEDEQPKPKPKPPPSPPETPPAQEKGGTDTLALLRKAEQGGDALELLVQVPPERLALALEGENPRMVALLLNFLNTKQASAVFKLLAAEARKEVTLHFNTQVLPRMEVMQRIAQGVLQKSCLLKEKPRAPEGPSRVVKLADLLRQLEKPERATLLATLEEREPNTAAEVKNFLYRFEDILRIENRSMQKVIMDLDMKSLAMALKGAPEDIQNKFKTSLSKRAQETFLEEMELLQSLNPAQQQAAQKEILDVVQRLDLAGELVMT